MGDGGLRSLARLLQRDGPVVVTVLRDVDFQTSGAYVAVVT